MVPGIMLLLLLPFTFCLAEDTIFRVYGCKCWSCCSCSPRSRTSGVGGEIEGRLRLHAAVDETPVMEVGDDVSWEEVMEMELDDDAPPLMPMIDGIVGLVVSFGGENMNCSSNYLLIYGGLVG